MESYLSDQLKLHKRMTLLTAHKMAVSVMLYYPFSLQPKKPFSGYLVTLESLITNFTGIPEVSLGLEDIGYISQLSIQFSVLINTGYKC